MFNIKKIIIAFALVSETKKWYNAKWIIAKRNY